MRRPGRIKSLIPTAVFSPHHDKPLLKVGQLNDADTRLEQDKLPAVKSAAAMSFYDMHEYIAKAGYSLIHEHAY